MSIYEKKVKVELTVGEIFEIVGHLKDEIKAISTGGPMTFYCAEKNKTLRFTLKYWHHWKIKLKDII